MYPHPATVSTETKTTSSSSYPTPINPRRHPVQSSNRRDDISMMSNHLMHRNRILPQEAASNRLKTLRSLLFRGHKTLGMDPMTRNDQARHHNRDLDSTLSEYHIRSLSQSMIGSQLPKSRYEEQEDCVELKSECSILASHNHGLMNRIKFHQEPRQINCWDDI